MNDSYEGNPQPAEPEGAIEDQAPADAGQQTAHDAEPEGDVAEPFSADDIDWEAAGVQPDGVPDSAADYGLTGTGIAEVDEILESLAEHGDPGLDAWAEQAHRLGLTHAQFSAITGFYVQQQLGSQRTWDDVAEQFGPDGDQLLQQVDTFGHQYLSERSKALIQQAPPSPALISVMSDLMIAVGLQPPGFTPSDDDVPDTGGNAIADKKQLQQLMASEKYRRGDKATITAVRNGFRKLSEAKAKGFTPK
jgi:hypothetical protein